MSFETDSHDKALSVNQDSECFQKKTLEFFPQILSKINIEIQHERRYEFYS